MGEARLNFDVKVESAYRRDAVCCKRYNISATHFSLRDSTDEDVYSEEHFSLIGLLDSI